MKNVDVYPTRIDIYPWPSAKRLDSVMKVCSSDYDRTIHKRKTKAFCFDEETQVLSVMRGCDLTWLTQVVGGYPRFMNPDKFSWMKRQYRVKTLPRNKSQIQVIKFLSGIGEYGYTQRYSQIALNSEPGFGKTYCSIVAIMERRVRTIIIVHNDIILNQWISGFMEHTNIPDKRIATIHGSDEMEAFVEKPINVDIILITHPTVGRYISTKGIPTTREWFTKLGCGLKVIDEVHYWFGNITQIDLCTNIEKNIYLTASMTRSDRLEKKLFKRYFGNTVAIGEEFGYTKNVVYTFIDYDSSPLPEYQAYVMTSRGPSPTNFAKYAFEFDKYKTAETVLMKTFEEARTHVGRTLIIAARIFVCEMIAEMVRKAYPELTVGTVHSRNTAEVNFATKDSSDVIVATNRGLGLGTDIANLRTVIITELYTSEVTSIQLPKRLRPIKGKDSYCYDLCDYGFEFMENMVKKRTRVLKKTCKLVQHKEFTDY